MDRIRMFYSNLDTQPRTLIRHFMRYLGFYVEEIVGNTTESDVESLIDIYIVSDGYVSEKSTNLNIINKWKTIMIYMDGWMAEELKGVCSIEYEEQEDLVFLEQLCRHIVDILSERMDISRRLIGDCDDLKRLLDKFRKLYVKRDILQMALFARCFYAQRGFFQVAHRKYYHFIQDLEELASSGEDCGLAQYMHLMACYEMDMICKVNSFTLLFDPSLLLEKCERLLRKYVENEELHLLQADIDMQLIGIWNKAGNEYADIRLSDCAYAYLWQGNILHKYARDRRAAISQYQEAIQRKEDYFAAWFQIGECYREQMDHISAVRAYEKVLEILDGRYRKHVLAPPEITCMYEAALAIAEIDRVWLRNSRSAEYYFAVAAEIREEVGKKRYFKRVWRDEEACARYFPFIRNELDKRLDRLQEQLAEGRRIYYEQR